jgi:hypothetical protein
VRGARGVVRSSKLLETSSLVGRVLQNKAFGTLRHELAENALHHLVAKLDKASSDESESKASSTSRSGQTTEDGSKSTVTRRAENDARINAHTAHRGFIARLVELAVLDALLATLLGILESDVVRHKARVVEPSAHQSVVHGVVDAVVGREAGDFVKRLVVERAGKSIRARSERSGDPDAGVFTVTGALANVALRIAGRIRVRMAEAARDPEGLALAVHTLVLVASLLAWIEHRQVLIALDNVWVRNADAGTAQERAGVGHTKSSFASRDASQSANTVRMELRHTTAAHAADRKATAAGNTDKRIKIARALRAIFTVLQQASGLSATSGHALLISNVIRAAVKGREVDQAETARVKVDHARTACTASGGTVAIRFTQIGVHLIRKLVAFEGVVVDGVAAGSVNNLAFRALAVTKPRNHASGAALERSTAGSVGLALCTVALLNNRIGECGGEVKVAGGALTRRDLAASGVLRVSRACHTRGTKANAIEIASGNASLTGVEATQATLIAVRVAEALRIKALNIRSRNTAQVTSTVAIIISEQRGAATGTTGTARCAAFRRVTRSIGIRGTCTQASLDLRQSQRARIAVSGAVIKGGTSSSRRRNAMRREASGILCVANGSSNIEARTVATGIKHWHATSCGIVAAIKDPNVDAIAVVAVCGEAGGEGSCAPLVVENGNALTNLVVVGVKAVRRVAAASICKVDARVRELTVQGSVEPLHTATSSTDQTTNSVVASRGCSRTCSVGTGELNTTTGPRADRLIALGIERIATIQGINLGRNLGRSELASATRNCDGYAMPSIITLGVEAGTNRNRRSAAGAGKVRALARSRRIAGKSIHTLARVAGAITASSGIRARSTGHKRNLALSHPIHIFSANG